MTGTELLNEFRKWREATGYKFEDTMNEGVLLKKIKTECDLPDGAIERGARTKKGYKQTFNIKQLKQHFKLGCLLLKADDTLVEMENEVSVEQHEVETCEELDEY